MRAQCNRGHQAKYGLGSRLGDAHATGTHAGEEVPLAEYTSLRAEIERRANIHWNVFALQIGQPVCDF